MWLVGFLGSFVLAVWLVIMGIAHLYTRYHHSMKSKRMLAAIAAGAWLLALLVMRAWPALPRWWSLTLTTFLALPIFVGLAVGACELWRLRLQSSFDYQLERLEQEEAELLQRLNDIRTAVHTEALRLRESEVQSKKSEDHGKRYRLIVDKWQQGEGVARIRSLRVAEWEEQYRGFNLDDLKRKREELLCLGAEARQQGDEDRVDMVNVELAVVQLCELEHATEEPSQAAATSGPERVDRLLNQQEQVNRELEGLRDQISEWKLRKHDFLARRIKL